MNEQEFKVFGENEVLKNCKINIVKVNEQGVEKKETLLCNGKQYSIKTEDEVGAIYTVYFSYNDSLVNIIKYENILRGTNEEINNFYITKNQSAVLAKLIGKKNNLKIGKGHQVVLMPIVDYFKEQKIESEQDQIRIRILFLDNYLK
jgi:hypothetical protein